MELEKEQLKALQGLAKSFEKSQQLIATLEMQKQDVLQDAKALKNEINSYCNMYLLEHGLSQLDYYIDLNTGKILPKKSD